MRLHLERGDDVNARDDQGMTLLMLSAARNNGRICRLLLDAGAESALLDSQGQDALSIATKAGASEALLAFKGHLANATAIYEPETTQYLSATYALGSDETQAQAKTAPAELTMFADAPMVIRPPESLDPIAPSIGEMLTDDWVAEDYELPPEGDPTLVTPTYSAQAAITHHVPLDTSTDWSDFEVFLPDYSAPLPRGDDADTRDSLRLLLLRAVRESSVPSFAVEDLSRESDGLVNADSESQLCMVLNDLGAEVDERLEIEFPFESHVVFINREETEEEEALVASAMAYLDELASRRNDPIRIYLKTGLRGKLLSAEEEVGLAKAMESFIAKALDALSSWDEGMARVCDSAELIRSGIHPLRWMTLGQDEEMDEAEQTAGAEISAEPEELLNDESREVTTGQSASTVFFAGVDLLNKFMASTRSAHGESQLRCREILDDLRLRRDFLLALPESSECAMALESTTP